MPTTSRHALPYPLGTDPAEDIDAHIQALADALDSKVVVFAQGTLASRPTSTPGSPGITGRFYYVTSGASAGVLFYDYGTGWLDLSTLLADGAVTDAKVAAAAAIKATKLDPFAQIHTSLPGSPYDGQIILFQTTAMLNQNVLWTLRWNASASKWHLLGGDFWHVDTAGSLLTNDNVIYQTAGAPSITCPATGRYEVRWGCTFYNGSGATNGAQLAVINSAGAVGAPTITWSNVLNGWTLPGERASWVDIANTGGRICQLGYRSVVNGGGSVVLHDSFLALRPLYLVTP